MAFIQINRDDGGRILNVSQTGLCFETFGSIEREKLLRFWFSLDLRDRIEASGKLAWLDADRRIGGLRFLDLSAKAQRHLREHLKKAGGERQPKATVFLAAMAKRSAGEVAAKPQPKASVFLSALAKRSEGEVAAKPQTLDGAVPRADEGGTGYAEVSGTGAVLGRYARQPQADVAALSGIGMVPLERYQTSKRQQFVRGILLGALASLAIATAAWYLGGKRTSSQSGPTAPVATRARTAPVTPVSSEASEAASTPALPSPAADREPAGPRYSPDKPSPHSLFVPSGSEMKRVAERTGVESRDGQAKVAKKSSATPQQLWVALQQGNTNAAVALAERYLQGDGVPMNCDQARILLLVASEKSNADAIRRLHELDKTGCPTAPAASASKTQSSSTQPLKP